MREFTAGENDGGVRLSRFVLRVCRGLPNNVLYKSFRTGRIKVNGKKANADAHLVPGDLIQLYLNDEFFPSGAPVPKPAAGSIPVTFVYDSADISILYKPAGLLCHSDAPGCANLLDAWTAELVRRGEYCPEKENAFTPAFCNRLDRNTEGLLIAAKTAAALRDMNALIKAGLVEKEYLCITAGRPPEGVHNAFLARNRANKTVSVRANSAPDAKPITTGVRVAAQNGALCLCEIRLYTGRTHQIRAHLAFLGAPVLGDGKYGNAPVNKMLPHPQKGQCLCAFLLRFSPDIPAQSSLSRLAGAAFTCDSPNVLAVWRGIGHA